MEFLSQIVYDNSIKTWLISVVIAIISIIFLQLLRGWVARKVSSLATQTDTKIDDLVADLIRRTKFIFILIISLYFGSLILNLPGTVITFIRTAATAMTFIQIAFWGNGLITFWASHQVDQATDQDAASATSMNVLSYVAKVILWSVITILILDNIPGIEVDSLIASLGIGGVAVALAVQNILGDLFASLSIALDKPFVIGDFLVIGDYRGTVERIGMNSTRIRSQSGEELIFSNSDLVQSRISNYKTMARRRVHFELGIKGETPYDKLVAIPGILEEIVESQDKATFDRAHFREFGDFALKYDVVYHVEGPDYWQYMDIQQAINLEIIKRFEADGIEFAYPTQVIHLEKKQITAKERNI
jgi:small-conductance mechanosensitive channel